MEWGYWKALGRLSAELGCEEAIEGGGLPIGEAPGYYKSLNSNDM
jgi:hypothetical protein